MSEYRVEIPQAVRVRTGRRDLFSFEVPAPYQDSVWQLVRSEEEAGREKLRIAIDRGTRKKSVGPGSQNNHFHGHCRQIALWHGNSITAIKEWIKQKAMEEMGYPHETMPDESIRPMSVSDADSNAVSILIECAHQAAAEEGIDLIEEEP